MTASGICCSCRKPVSIEVDSKFIVVRACPECNTDVELTWVASGKEQTGFLRKDK